AFLGGLIDGLRARGRSLLVAEDAALQRASLERLREMAAQFARRRPGSTPRELAAHLAAAAPGVRQGRRPRAQSPPPEVEPAEGESATRPLQPAPPQTASPHRPRERERESPEGEEGDAGRVAATPPAGEALEQQLEACL